MERDGLLTTQCCLDFSALSNPGCRKTQRLPRQGPWFPFLGLVRTCLFTLWIFLLFFFPFCSLLTRELRSGLKRKEKGREKGKKKKGKTGGKKKRIS